MATLTKFRRMGFAAAVAPPHFQAGENGLWHAFDAIGAENGIDRTACGEPQRRADVVRCTRLKQPAGVAEQAALMAASAWKCFCRRWERVIGQARIDSAVHAKVSKGHQADRTLDQLSSRSCTLPPRPPPV